MKKTRVKKGEKYWYVVMDCDGVDVECAYDNYLYTDRVLYESGNYFTTKEQAESMARKLRAVLKGAEVIEMPSEKEFKEARCELNEREGYSSNFEPSDIFYGGFNCCLEFLKSKIIK